MFLEVELIRAFFSEWLICCLGFAVFLTLCWSTSSLEFVVFILVGLPLMVFLLVVGWSCHENAGRVG